MYFWELAERQLSIEKPRFEYSGYWRWLNALLFSLNSALLVLPVASVRMKYPVLMIGRRIRYFVYAHWPFPIPSFVLAADSYLLDFEALAFSSASLLFLLFVMTARLRAGSNFLRPVPGVVAVAGLPVVIKLLQGIPFALYVEPVAAAVCVLLYFYGRWRLPSLVSIFLLGVHSAFWFCGTPSETWYWPAYPLIGFCSALVWAVYVKRSEKSRANPESCEAKLG